jgi:hypothetical protein
MLCAWPKAQKNTIAPQGKQSDIEKKTQIAHTRTIIINNCVTDDHLKVRYCGEHMPDTFSLTIGLPTDDQYCEIFSYVKHPQETQESCSKTALSITIENDELEIYYSYSFVWGQYKAKKRVRFRIPDEVTELKISFSFSDDERVLIPGALRTGPIEKVS